MQTSPLLDEAYVATGQVVSVFRHFPLNFHANALPAAQAAYCAGQQAPQFFWDLHDWLFARQAVWSEAADAAGQFRQQVVALGADGAQYDACLSDPATAARIQKDVQEGQALGVTGTPGFFINDWFLSGAYPFEEFQQIIAKAGQGLHPPATPTPLPAGAQFYDADPAHPGFTYDGSPTLGAADAPLVLLAFEDFKCGYCAQHAKQVEPALKTKYVTPGQVRLVFKFLPIYAPKAALASLCAADQGQFWPFHDLLFDQQSVWKEGDDAQMVAYATDLGLDIPRFSQCLKDAPGQARIDGDNAMGGEAGVRGTPYFFLIDRQSQNGQRIPGALGLAQFEQAIQGLLNPAPAPTPAQ